MPSPAAPAPRCLLLQVLGISDTSWNSMKKFLGNRKVKEQILSFDARSLTGPIRKQVQKIMQVSEWLMERGRFHCASLPRTHVLLALIKDRR